MDLRLYRDYTIHLIRTAFSGGTPKALPEGVDAGILVYMAIKHSVANIIYEPLCKIGALNQENERELKKIYNLAMLNDATQSYYLELISDAFEKNGIPHCALKGPVIKALYPRTDFRQSGDLDIYVPELFREKAKGVMTGLGFMIERYNLSDADDVYILGKKAHIELHRILVSNETPWQAECQKITDRLVLAKDKSYTYEMTPEDYYLYMIAHMAKHMNYSGMGIRMVLDVFIYLQKYAETLDRTVLNKRLKLCGLDRFEKNICKLVGYWFYDKEEEELIKKLGDYIFISGSFGTREQLDAYFSTKDAGKTDSIFVAKIVYYVKFFFRPYGWMCDRYPILKRVPFLLPFCWVHRALKTLLFEREKTRTIASRYDGVDLEKSRKIQDFKKEIGL